MAKLIVNERPFEIGDEVFEFAYGIGCVIDVEDDNDYPISVSFIEFKEVRYFKADGVGGEGGRRCLFHLDVAQELGFVDMEINVTEPFKPIVGQLYYRPESNEVLEYVKNNQYYLDSGISVDYSSKRMINARKIKEFDEINLPFNVYYNNNGIIDQWIIKELFLMASEETFFVTDSCNDICINRDGKAFGLPVKFYRNKHRAERLGGINA